jgi:vitamin-K-epoxide reductase (warfarin-sensitive)
MGLATRVSALVSISALLGVCVSLYALYIEHQVEQAKAMGLEYVAACDLGKRASCSAVLSSVYGHIFSHWGLVAKGSSLDLPNALTGLVFYLLALSRRAVGLPRLLFLLASVAALAFSLYLAYVLAFVLKDFCLVCVTSYVLNALIFAGAAREALWSNPSSGKKSIYSCPSARQAACLS